MSNGGPLSDLSELVPEELRRTCDPYCKAFWNSQQPTCGCTPAPSPRSSAAADTYDPLSDPMGEPFYDEYEVEPCQD